ncbi:hypothetical protein IAD21_04105 [Abditibacteriota bacterium]|nr:hypothetical protein IAD21_04105 [Abditibacteriota bacterium]
MKKWSLLLLLPVCVGASIYTTSLFRAQAAPLPTEPRIENQAQLDALARQKPGANFDRIGHAFGNAEARLFWNTDFEAAKRQAIREGKPILALRLLGNLSDEYSCANSRFFRVLFYPQSQINQRLRRDFVLFWSSERPVPIVTIDMGDGRILKRTLTGNSAHYLLDSTGRPLDVFPGLTTPATFESWLASSQQLAQNFKAQPQETRDAWLANWHTDQLREAMKLRAALPVKRARPFDVDLEMKRAIDSNPLEDVQIVTPIPASVAASLAVDKRLVEAPMLGLDPNSFPVPSAILTSSSPVLDEATRARIRAMNPFASQDDVSRAPIQNVALAQTSQKSAEETRFQTLIRAFEANLRADTSQNQNFSVSIHALFARRHEGDLTALNRRIYDRLFLTPRSDEWLGLKSDTAFSALQNDGVILPSESQPRLTSN